MSEAAISINGHTLTEGEAMTVRVALTDFMFTLADPNRLGDDEHGRRMTAGYRDCARTIIRLMATSASSQNRGAQ